MATRIFPRYGGSGGVQDAQTNHYVVPSVRIDGSGENQWTLYPMLSTQGASVQSHTVTSINGPTSGVQDTVPIFFVSAPVDQDVTISGTITLNLRSEESSMNANAAVNCRIYKLSSTGILTTIATTARTTELGTNESAANFTVTPSSTPLNKGDRLAFEPFFDDSTSSMASGFTLTLYYNGASNATGDTWIEFNETFGLLETDPSVTTIYPTNIASAVATASDDKEAWTSRGGGVQSAITNTAAGPTSGIQITSTAGGTVIDWFTKPLTAFTLQAPVLVNSRVLVSNVSAQAAIKCEIAVVNADGSSPSIWGTGGRIPGPSTTEVAQEFYVAGDDTAVAEGKRLRIRFYVDDDNAFGNLAAGFTMTLRYAGTTGGSSGDTFLIFNNTLTESLTLATAQAQAVIKVTSRGYSQAQATIKATNRGFAQAQGYVGQRVYTDWTLANNPLPGAGNAPHSITFGNGYWVAVTNGSEIIYTTDPTGTWTIVNDQLLGTSQTVCVNFGGDYFVVGHFNQDVGRIAYAYKTPVGGFTENISARSFTFDFRSIAYGAPYWVAVGGSGQAAYTTDPTGTWTPVDVGFGTSNIQRVWYADGHWIVVGNNGKMATATDPTGTWTANTSHPWLSTETIGDVKHGNGLWVAVGATNNAKSATATDPTGTWTQGDTFTTNPAQFVQGPYLAYGNYGNDGGVWVGVGQNDSSLRARISIAKHPELPGGWSNDIGAHNFLDGLFGHPESVWYAQGYWVVGGTQQSETVYVFQYNQNPIGNFFTTVAQAQATIGINISTINAFSQSQASIKLTKRAHSQAKALISGPTTALDTFTRTVSNGLGTADIGGNWTLFADPTLYNVNGTKGLFASTAGAALRSPFIQHSEIRVEFSHDTSPNNGIILYLIRSGKDSGGDWESISIFNDPTEGLMLFNTNSEGVVVGSYSTNEIWVLKVRLFNSDSETRIFSKVWRLDDPEPEWQDEYVPSRRFFGGHIWLYNEATGTLTADNLSIVVARPVASAQAQAQIKQTYNSFAQSQAYIKSTDQGISQAQADIKQIYNGFGQSQANIKSVSNSFAQTQGWVEVTSNGFAQSRADIKQTYSSFAQAKATIKTVYISVAQAQGRILRSYNSFAQTQGHIKQISRGLSQAQGDIKQTYNSFAQSQSSIKTTYFGLGQASADIKATSTTYAQGQADIRQTYNGFAQSQAKITRSYSGFAQSGAEIKQTYRGFGQAQARILQYYNSFAQASADIKQTYRDFAQAQATIAKTYQGYAQAQGSVLAVNNSYAQAQSSILTSYQSFSQVQAKINAFGVTAFAQAGANIRGTDLEGAGQAQAKINAYDVEAVAQSQANIKQTYRSFAQAQAKIKQTYRSYAQAQSDILVVYNGHAQAQAQIKNTYNVYGQSQGIIRAVYNGVGQSQADIKAISGGYGQSQGDIKQTYTTYGQSQADILVTYFGFAQAQSKIKAANLGFAQTQTDVKTTYRGYAQAQALIGGINFAWSQAHARIKVTSRGFAQAQSNIKVTSRVFAQARALILRTERGYGQSQAVIKATSNGCAQAQGTIKSIYSGLAQAQADTKQTSNEYGQSRSTIKQTYRGFGQAQGQILILRAGYGQSQGSIIATSVVTAQSQSDILVTTNKCAQAGTIIRTGSIVFAQSHASIKATDTQFAQALATIGQKGNTGFAQAQADILAVFDGIGYAQAVIVTNVIVSAQAQALIPSKFGVGYAQGLIVVSHVIKAINAIDKSPLEIKIMDKLRIAGEARNRALDARSSDKRRLTIRSNDKG